MAAPENAILTPIPDPMRDPFAPKRAAPALLVAAAFLVSAGCWVESHAPEEAGATEEAPGDPWSQVETDLRASARAWNAGDLEGFLADYRRDPTTTYIGSSGLVVGYQGIRGRYAPLFGPDARRDSLRFEDLRVRPLGDSTALAIGRYVLERADTLASTGIFTLVLKREGEGWTIVHDHSSALEPSGG